MFGFLNKDKAITKEDFPDASENKDELISFVEKEFAQREKDRRPYELQWRLNIAFIEGNQHIDINTATMALDETPKMYWWQEREVFNHVAPTIETRVAKLSRMQPILRTRPGTNEQEDLRSSKVGTQILQNQHYDGDIQNKLNLSNAWMEFTGTSFFKNIWEPNKGRIIGNGEDGQPVREGDIDTIVVPPYEIYPDSSYKEDVEYCKSIIHAKAYSIEDIADIWGVEVQEENTSMMQLQPTMGGSGGLGYGQNGFAMNAVKLKGHALVKEYWERPSKKCPQGRLIVIAGKELLHSGPLPYPVDADDQLGLPFTKEECIERPGCFWGKSVVERLIPIQRRYNALRNRKAEYLNRVAIGQYSVEQDSRDMDYLESNLASPGFIDERPHGTQPPQPIMTPPLPSSFENEEQTLLQELSMISGVSEMSRHSEAPPGIKSGKALSIVEDQDDTRLNSTFENIKSFLIKNGKQWLRLYKAFANGPRTLSYVGKSKVIEVMSWSAADIKSDDVIIESAITESISQRRQILFDLLQTPLVLDDTGRISKHMKNKLLDMLNLATWDNINDDEQLHISKAERENMLMQAAKLDYPDYYDDHVLHIDAHNRFRLTTDFEELASQMPIVVEIFDMHVQMHTEFIFNQQQQMLNQ